MQTRFSRAQLADPDIAVADKILRACVHCGFCMATCPTYVLMGDESESPRGRIYLIKHMLEGDKPASTQVTRHIDRCLSCLSCMTTCPSGVNYMHLVDHARAHIARTFPRPRSERALRRLLATVLPRPRLLRLALASGRLARPFGRWFPAALRDLLKAAPASPPASRDAVRPGVYPAAGKRVMRVALMMSCVQRVLAPEIDAASIRLLTRHGVEVVVAAGQGCCGALSHHLGWSAEALASARRNVAAWMGEIESEGLDAIVVNASGCGVVVRNYGFMLRGDPASAPQAARVSELVRDVTQVMAGLGLKVPKHAASQRLTGKVVALHTPCSLRHGLGVGREPALLLESAGFEVREPAEAHLCCGSAGLYGILQPQLSGLLGERKADHIEKLEANIVATGNIGCLTHISSHVDGAVVHTAELLDWATGGPRPPAVGEA